MLTPVSVSNQVNTVHPTVIPPGPRRRSQSPLLWNNRRKFRTLWTRASVTFVQAYNAQVAVEPDFQLIVGQQVTQAANDKQQMQPLVEVIQEQSGQNLRKWSVTVAIVRRRI